MHSLGDEVRAMLPSFVEAIFSFGWLGVVIFFVLSGFVITHSLRKVPPTAASLGNFILRRQIRLDPLYWLTLLLTVLTLYFPPSGVQTTHFPSWRSLLANLFYLQGILDAYPWVSVAWTLCLELQFYLFFLLLIALHSIFNRTQYNLENRWHGLAWLLLGTGVLFSTIGSLVRGAWMVSAWPSFALGCLSYLGVQKLAPRWSVLVLAAWILGRQVVELILGPAQPVNFIDWLEK